MRPDARPPAPPPPPPPQEGGGGRMLQVNRARLLKLVRERLRRQRRGERPPKKSRSKFAPPDEEAVRASVQALYPRLSAAERRQIHPTPTPLRTEHDPLTHRPKVWPPFGYMGPVHTQEAERLYHFLLPMLQRLPLPVHPDRTTGPDYERFVEDYVADTVAAIRSYAERHPRYNEPDPRAGPVPLGTLPPARLDDTARAELDFLEDDIWEGLHHAWRGWEHPRGHYERPIGPIPVDPRDAYRVRGLADTERPETTTIQFDSTRERLRYESRGHFLAELELLSDLYATLPPEFWDPVAGHTTAAQRRAFRKAEHVIQAVNTGLLRDRWSTGNDERPSAWARRHADRIRGSIADLFDVWRGRDVRAWRRRYFEELPLSPYDGPVPDVERVTRPARVLHRPVAPPEPVHADEAFDTPPEWVAEDAQDDDADDAWMDAAIAEGMAEEAPHPTPASAAEAPATPPRGRGRPRVGIAPMTSAERGRRLRERRRIAENALRAARGEPPRTLRPRAPPKPAPTLTTTHPDPIVDPDARDDDALDIDVHAEETPESPGGPYAPVPKPPAVYDDGRPQPMRPPQHGGPFDYAAPRATTGPVLPESVFYWPLTWRRDPRKTRANHARLLDRHLRPMDMDRTEFAVPLRPNGDDDAPTPLLSNLPVYRDKERGGLLNRRAYRVALLTPELEPAEVQTRLARLQGMRDTLRQHQPLRTGFQMTRWARVLDNGEWRTQTVAGDWVPDPAHGPEERELGYHPLLWNAIPEIPGTPVRRGMEERDEDMEKARAEKRAQTESRASRAAAFLPNPLIGQEWYHAFHDPERLVRDPETNETFSIGQHALRVLHEQILRAFQSSSRVRWGTFQVRPATDTHPAEYVRGWRPTDVTLRSREGLHTLLAQRDLLRSRLRDPSRPYPDWLRRVSPRILDALPKERWAEWFAGLRTGPEDAWPQGLPPVDAYTTPEQESERMVRFVEAALVPVREDRASRDLHRVNETHRTARRTLLAAATRSVPAAPVPPGTRFTTRIQRDPTTGRLLEHTDEYDVRMDEPDVDELAALARAKYDVERDLPNAAEEEPGETMETDEAPTAPSPAPTPAPAPAPAFRPNFTPPSDFPLSPEHVSDTTYPFPTHSGATRSESREMSWGRASDLLYPYQPDDHRSGIVWHSDENAPLRMAANIIDFAAIRRKNIMEPLLRAWQDAGIRRAPPGFRQPFL